MNNRKAYAVDQDADGARAHEELTRIASVRCGLDFEEAQWIMVALRTEIYVQLGFASFLEYLERVLGYAPRAARERLRVAEALEDLPELGRALREGVLHWSAVRELTRVAIKETELAWIEAARGQSSRDIERMVS